MKGRGFGFPAVPPRLGWPAGLYFRPATWANLTLREREGRAGDGAAPILSALLTVAYPGGTSGPALAHQPSLAVRPADSPAHSPPAPLPSFHRLKALCSSL